MKPKRIHSTKQQREDLQRLKTLLAENGYMIMTPLKRYRRNPHDFIASHKDGHATLLIRVGRKVIEYRSYERDALSQRFEEELRSNITHPFIKRKDLPKIKDNDIRKIIVDQDRALLTVIEKGIDFPRNWKR